MKKLLPFICIYILSYTHVLAQCVAPASLSAVPNNDVGVTLNWDHSLSSEPVFDLYVVEYGDPAPTADTPPTYTAVSSGFVLTSFEGQSFDESILLTYYVRAVCNGSSSSPISDGLDFWTRTPVNDECASAILLEVHPDQFANTTVSGDTRGATLSLQPTTCQLLGIPKDVWYKFVATNTNHTVNLQSYFSGYWPSQSVYAGSCGELQLLSCSMDMEHSVAGLTPGDTYYVRIHSAELSEWANITYELAITSPPLNDEPYNAVPVTVSDNTSCPSPTVGYTAGATPSIVTGSCNPGNKDVWFSFNATAPTHVIKITSMNGPYTSSHHELYTGSAFEPVSVYCAANNESVANNLTVGQTYFIRVFPNATNPQSSEMFTLCVTTPAAVPNDECSTAIVVPVNNSVACTDTVTGSLAGATASSQPLTCAGSADDDVWYTFTAVGNQLRINLTTQSQGSIRFALYSGSDCAGLSFVTCSNSEGLLESSNIPIGQTYFIRVWSSSANPTNGIFNLCVNNTASLVGTTIDQTAAQLASMLVSNPCVSISNISSQTGTNFSSVNGIGYFVNPGNPSFPLTSGLVLSTGNAALVGGPNTSVQNNGSASWPGDADLDALMNTTGPSMSSKNASKLEFDFTTATEFMSFDFVFASEEYGQFQCTYSDAFAFLLTDLETGITKNLAVVPGTTVPVSVVTIRDNINNGSCSSANPEYFDIFSDPMGANNMQATNFNGYTHVMTASSAILPNHPYHIKLVVADRMDTQFDSAVFIQAGSFASGPPSCTDKVLLSAFVDANANGLKEENELPFTFGTFAYTMNDAEEPVVVNSSLGTYIIYDDQATNSYDFSYVINPEYAPYYSAGTINYQNISITPGSGTQQLLFPITLTQPYNDVSVTIVNMATPQSGFGYNCLVEYTNNGLTPAAGSLEIIIDPVLEIYGSSEIGIPTGSGYTYNFVNLLPGQKRSIVLNLGVPPIPIVNIGDVVTNAAIATVPSGDINPANNVFVDSQVVVAAYDPNDKAEAHGPLIAIDSFDEEDYLYYTIRFQNEGTANAVNIRLEDTLDPMVNPATLRMVSSSHDYILERVDNQLTWKFDYIHLPSKFADEAASQGYVQFAVKLHPGFQLGDIVENTASIFFDSNPPIVTNTVLTEFVSTLGVTERSVSKIQLYPNPASGFVRIEAAGSDILESVKIFDLTGKNIQTISGIRAGNTTITTSDLKAGMYFVEIRTAEHITEVRKLLIR